MARIASGACMWSSDTHCPAFEDDAGLATMPVNVVDVLDLVENFKGTTGSEPFKNHPAGGKHHPDGNAADPADPAYVLVAQQLKHA
jgi:hypothetical protein